MCAAHLTVSIHQVGMSMVGLCMLATQIGIMGMHTVGMPLISLHLLGRCVAGSEVYSGGHSGAEGVDDST